MPDPFAPFVPYVAARLKEDPHVWARALDDEVVALGFLRSDQPFRGRVRQLKLRPHGEACAGVKGWPAIEITHPPSSAAAGSASGATAISGSQRWTVARSTPTV
jgi:hypothetical protein